jgi:hypothetical protein
MQHLMTGRDAVRSHGTTLGGKLVPYGCGTRRCRRNRQNGSVLLTQELPTQGLQELSLRMHAARQTFALFHLKRALYLLHATRHFLECLVLATEIRLDCLLLAMKLRLRVMFQPANLKLQLFERHGLC